MTFMNVKQQNLQSAPFFKAAGEGRVNEVLALLDAGADSNARDASGWTALMIAARFGHEKVVRVLVAAGADVNALNPDCWTPLMLAAGHGMVEVVKFLLEAGADETLKDRHGNDAINLAIATGDWAAVKPFCGLLPKYVRGWR